MTVEYSHYISYFTLLVGAVTMLGILTQPAFQVYLNSRRSRESPDSWMSGTLASRVQKRQGCCVRSGHNVRIANFYAAVRFAWRFHPRGPRTEGNDQGGACPPGWPFAPEHHTA